MSTYWELLKDPRWQRKRLEIMQRDEFACTDCDAKDRTLNVHHTYYASGRKPWEYEDESLKTLCEICHKATEHELVGLRRLIGAMDQAGREIAAAYLKAQLRMYGGHDHKLDVAGYYPAMGTADAYGIQKEDVWAVAVDGKASHYDLLAISGKRRIQCLRADLRDAEEKES